MIKVFGASVIGKAHIKSDLPCQDSHAFDILPNIGIIAAVSDGMGSARYAHIGSDIASMYFVKTLKERYYEEMSDDAVIDLIKQTYLRTQERLALEADIMGCHIKDLNATLLVFLSLHSRQFYGQVGDCCLIGKTETGYKVIASQQRGEYANATFSVCNPDSIENGFFARIDGFYQDVALMSDGVESVTVSSSDQSVSHLFYDPFFKAFHHPQYESKSVSDSLSRFLSSDRINQKTDDDKTLLFIHLDEALYP